MPPQLYYLMPIALFTTFAFCYAILWLALKGGLASRLAIDKPNERSLHVAPVARAGGLALIPVVLLSWMWQPQFDALLAGLTFFLLAVSYLDDRYSISIALRFGMHFLVTGALIFNRLQGADLFVGALFVLSATWMINLYNFMDGSDGLAGGMALFGFGAYGVASSLAGDSAAIFSAMNFTVAAAALAFLCFNFHPARIFLGDSGSVPLGFLAAALGLQGWNLGLWPLWFPALVFSPFVVDATVTLIKRILRREKFWQAHREHYYQRLVRMGLGHRKTAFIEYGLMMGSGVLAVVLLHAQSQVQVAALIVWCGLYCVAMMIVDSRWKAYIHKVEGQS